jgi:hypothetical protein
MASNMIIDYELILEEFIKIKERRLLLVWIINLNRISFKNVFFLLNKISKKNSSFWEKKLPGEFFESPYATETVY